MSLRSLVLFFHLLPAIFWIGQMIFMTLVLGPMSRKIHDPLSRANFFREVGQRSRPWIWASIVLLVLSGIGNLWLMGIPFASFFDPSFYASRFGRTLAIKLLFVALIILLTFLHDIGAMRYGASVRQQFREKRDTDSQSTRPNPSMRHYRLFGLWMGRITLIIGLIIVYLGASLLRG